MENKAHAMAAGIFVLLAAAMLIALASWLARDTGVRDPYEISTRESVTGLQSQAAVRYRGLDVGKVASIGFDAKAAGNVLVRLEIDRGAPVTQDTFATLSYQGVTGLAFVQLDDGGKAAPPLQTDDAKPARIPLRPGLLTKLTARGEAILEQVEKVTESMARLLDQANQSRVSAVLDNMGAAAQDTSLLAKRLQSTVDQRVDPALTQVAATLQSVQGSVQELGKAAADFGKTAQRLNQTDGPMDRLATGAQALSHAADSFNASTLPRVNRVTEETSRAVRQLARTANTINDNPQSLIYGTGAITPGPGEPGFVAPGAAR